MEPTHANRRVIIIVLAIVFVSLVLGGVTLAKTVSANHLAEENIKLGHQVASLTADLKKSSARSECRNKLNNESIGNFQADIRDLLIAGFHNDDPATDLVLQRMAKRPDPNILITRQCPKPLAPAPKGLTTTTKGNK